MKALGGVGNGVFEISEDLVGFESLAYVQADDPELFADLYRRIGDLMAGIWQRFLRQYADVFAICRFGDDLGFKTSTLVSPRIIRQHIIPQYRRVIDLIHAAEQAVPVALLRLHLQRHGRRDRPRHRRQALQRGRHRALSSSGSSATASGSACWAASTWTSSASKTPAEVYDIVLERGRRYRRLAQGYALGSGNSIPDYVPVDGYLAMIRAAQAIRAGELN